MKTTQVITLATLCAALVLAPSAMAQTGNSGSTSGSMSTSNSGSNRTEQRDTTPERQESPDLGWLGLLGLAGLAGLMKKPQQQVVRQTEVRTTPTVGGTPNVHK